MAREACAAHPPTSREPTPVRGVALVLGGQNPITLEYQIYPPPIDTLVTGMVLAAEIFLKCQKYLKPAHNHSSALNMTCTLFTEQCSLKYGVHMIPVRFVKLS